jgi:hypothetical protein
LPGDVVASPILHDGLLFVVPSDVPEYCVLDQRTGEIVLKKDLEVATSFTPSLALAGGHLFLSNDKGETLILEPSRKFTKLRHNELPEGSCASPVFSGSSIFLRGGEGLYRIGR